MNRIGWTNTESVEQNKEPEDDIGRESELIRPLELDELRTLGRSRRNVFESKTGRPVRHR